MGEASIPCVRCLAEGARAWISADTHLLLFNKEHPKKNPMIENMVTGFVTATAKQFASMPESSVLWLQKQLKIILIQASYVKKMFYTVATILSKISKLIDIKNY